MGYPMVGPVVATSDVRPKGVVTTYFIWVATRSVPSVDA
ncbi:hypothetical protein OROGR_016293 [Orobanche gracilis]